MRVPLLLLVAFCSLACFNPEVKTCAVTCDATRPCPGGNVCLTDGFCHAGSTESLCGNNNVDASPGIDSSTVDCGNGVIQLGLGEECDDLNGTSGDGCSSSCQEETGFVCLDQPSICRPNPTAAGELVITELLIDPDVTGDEIGEWFEIFNPTSTAFDLKGMMLVDDGSPQENVTIEVSLVIEAQSHLVLGVSTNTGVNGGAPVDFAYGSSAQLANNNLDDLSLVFGDTTIDRVSWVTAPNGASRSLSGSMYDAVSNDTSANYCAGVGVFGAGDEGTPGQQNPDC